MEQKFELEFGIVGLKGMHLLGLFLFNKPHHFNSTQSLLTDNQASLPSLFLQSYLIDGGREKKRKHLIRTDLSNGLNEKDRRIKKKLPLMPFWFNSKVTNSSSSCNHRVTSSISSKVDQD